MSGSSLAFEAPDGALAWHIMGAVKQALKIPKQQQKLCLGRDTLAPYQALPDGDVTLFLARSEPSCSQCLRRRPRLRYCSGCFSAVYCGSACQRAHWFDHRADCRRDVAAISQIAPDISLRSIDKKHEAVHVVFGPEPWRYPSRSLWHGLRSIQDPSRRISYWTSRRKLLPRAGRPARRRGSAISPQMGGGVGAASGRRRRRRRTERPRCASMLREQERNVGPCG